MIEGVIEKTKETMQKEIEQVSVNKTEYEPKIEMKIPNFIKAVERRAI